jgi:hypothetical protein
MDQDEMSNLYGGPSIDASYKVSYHLAKRFQRKNYFRNRTIRNKNCLNERWAIQAQLTAEPLVSGKQAMSIHLLIVVVFLQIISISVVKSYMEISPFLVPDEGYSGSAPCALNLISMFLFL